MTRSRQLAARNQDGFEVTLLWDTHSNEVSVELVDNRCDTAFAFVVEPDCALDAFRHPFAYAVLGAGFGELPELAGLTPELKP